jgi:hypothetical protein
MMTLSKWGSKAVRESDWNRFKTACLFSDIVLLQKVKRVLDLGVTVYGNFEGHESFAGKGTLPRKFRRARNIVEDVITKKLKEKRLRAVEIL